MSPADACMLVVIICVVIDLLGLSLTIPIMANFARLVQGEAKGCPSEYAKLNATVRHAMAMSAACQASVANIKANTGLLSSAYSIAAFISTMWMPVYSDKYGRRKAVLMSIFGSFLGFFGQGITCPTVDSVAIGAPACVGVPGGFYFLVFIRFFGGLFGGTVTVASAFVVDLYPQKERGKQFAKIGVCAMSAFTFGPSIGGGLSQFGLRVPLFVAAGFSLVAMAAAFKYVHNAADLGIALNKKESEPLKKKNDDLESVNVEPKEEVEKPIVVSKEPRVWIISFQTFCTTVAFNGVSSLMALLLVEPHLGVVNEADSVEEQGKKVGLWVSALVPTLALTQALVLMGLFPRVTKKVGLLGSGLVGCIILGVALFLMPFLPSAGYFFITQFLLAIGNGLSTNVSNTYLAKFSSSGNAAQVLAWGSRADTIGNVIGPALTFLYKINTVIPFIVAAAFGWLGAAACFLLVAMGGAGAGKDETKPIEKQSLIDQQRIDHAEEMKKKREDREAHREASSVALRKTHHPSWFFGKYGEYGPQMAELTQFLWEELRGKNHHYMIGSGIERVRQRSVQAHKDLLRRAINKIPPPNIATGDKEFIEGVAIFLSDSGHDEWALNLPGMTPESMISLLRTPH